MKTDPVSLAIKADMRRLIDSALPPKAPNVSAGVARALAFQRLSKTPEYRLLCLRLSRVPCS